MIWSKSASGGFALRRLLLLHVEDDLFVFRSVARALERTADVEHVTSVHEAVARLLAPHSFDAVLLDLSLPDAHGLSAVRDLRKATRLPIIVLTGAEDDIAEDAIEAGASYWVPKGDVEPARLMLTIRIETARMLLRSAAEGA